MTRGLKYTWGIVEATGDITESRLSESMIPFLATEELLYGRGSMFAPWCHRGQS